MDRVWNLGGQSRRDQDAENFWRLFYDAATAPQQPQSPVNGGRILTTGLLFRLSLSPLVHRVSGQRSYRVSKHCQGGVILALQDGTHHFNRIHSIVSMT